MNLGMPELIFIFLVALLLFGPAQLPVIGRKLGKAMNEFKKASADFRESLESEVGDIKKDLSLPSLTDSPAGGGNPAAGSGAPADLSEKPAAAADAVAPADPAAPAENVTPAENANRAEAETPAEPPATVDVPAPTDPGIDPVTGTPSPQRLKKSLFPHEDLAG